MSCWCLLQKESDMILLPVLYPRCHTDQVMKGGKTKVPICNTTRIRIRTAWLSPTRPSKGLTSFPRDELSISPLLPSPCGLGRRGRASTDNRTVQAHGFV